MTEQENVFLQMAVPAAIATMKATGVPASVTVAQAILESGWGQSRLALECNNYFGIKAAAGAAPDEYAQFPTWEYEYGKKVLVQADFARYATAADCFAAHAKLLAAAPRYAPAMAVRGDAAAFCEQLQACGYSTSPMYAQQLEELIREFDLTQYDAEPAGAALSTSTAISTQRR